MNMRTPEIMFQSNRQIDPPVADTPQDTLTVDTMEAPAEDNAQNSGRLMLCIKTPGMADMVSRALGQDDGVAVEVSHCSLAELADDAAFTVANYDILVLDIAPDDHAEMQALHDLRARASDRTRFLAITPEALTLAVARQLMEAGIDEVLPLTAVRPELREAQTGAPHMQYAAPSQNGTVLAIAQTRGGIGATTLALNLASMLSPPTSRRDKTPVAKVALLDLDFQNGDAAASLDIDDNGALIQLLKTRALPDAAFLKAAMVPYKDRFDVLPNPVEFAPFDAMTSEMVAQLVNELRHMYDHVIIGLPRAMVQWIEPILARADQLLLVTDTSVTGIRQARRLIDFYAEDNPGLPIEVVVSKEKKPMSFPKAVKEATKFLDRPFDIWVPNDHRSASKATDQGVPLVEVAKRSAVVKPLSQIVDRMQDIHASEKRRDA